MWGLTQKEERAILFLLCSFAAGGAILYWRQQQPPPPVPAELAVQMEAFAQQMAQAASPPDSLEEPLARSSAPAGRVNLNTATFDELVALPGIGAVMARRILEYRAAHGNFQRVEDLTKVRGIGRSKLAALRANIAVE